MGKTYFWWDGFSTPLTPSLVGSPRGCACTTVDKLPTDGTFIVGTTARETTGYLPVRRRKWNCRMSLGKRRAFSIPTWLCGFLSLCP